MEVKYMKTKIRNPTAINNLYFLKDRRYFI